jgi:uncharacterized protein YjiS (DUF1127 family)
MERTVNTAALSRDSAEVQAKGQALYRAATAFAVAVGAMLAAWARTDRDRRLLQTLPDHVLADMGLERIELPYGPEGDRHVWVGRARHN